MPFHARHVHRLIHLSKVFTSRVCWKEYCFVYEPTRSTFVNIRYNSRFIFLMRNRKVVYLLFSGQYRQVFRLVKILYQIVIGHRLASWTFSHSTDTVVYARCLNKANLSWRLRRQRVGHMIIECRGNVPYFYFRTHHLADLTFRCRSLHGRSSEFS